METMVSIAESVKEYGECLYFQASIAGNRAGTKYLLQMVDEEVRAVNWLIITQSTNNAEIDAIKYKLERLKERLEDATCTVFNIEC